MTDSLLARVVVPVASEDDADATCDALLPRLFGESDVTVVHVVEKAGGAPDKASVEQMEKRADAIFALVADRFDEAGLPAPATALRFDTDVVEGIVAAAHDADATAIAFTPRGGNRWVKMLAGDVATRLLDASDVPVVVLPDE